MKTFCNYFKQIFFIIIICFITSPVASVASDENTDKIKPPFGIRFYDIGTAQNFFLQDIDGENFELKNTKGY